MYQLNEQDITDSETQNPGGLFACCAKPENRVDTPTDRPDTRMEVCRVCSRRHFEVTVDPGKIGLEGAQVGG